MKKFYILFIIILMASSFAVCGGCGNIKPISNDFASPSDQTAIPETEKTPEPQPKENPSESGVPSTSDSRRKTIFYITSEVDNSSMLVQGGVTQASIDLDCDIIILGVLDADIEGQKRLIENAVATKADAIIINVADSESIADAVSEAYCAGTPIILVGGIKGTEDYSVCLIVDNINAGGAAAAEMLRKLKNNGLLEEEPAEIVVQISVTESRTISERIEGFKAFWDEQAPLQWVVLWDDIKLNEGDYERAIENGREFLTSYPNLKGVFAPNDLSTEGFAVALIEMNRSDITLVGFNLYKNVLELIRNENYNASIMLRLEYKMGYEAMVIALELVNGGTVAEKTVDMGVRVVDIGNIDSPEVQLWINGR